MSSRDTVFYMCFYTDATESSFAQKKKYNYKFNSDIIYHYF